MNKSKKENIIIFTIAIWFFFWFSLAIIRGIQYYFDIRPDLWQMIPPSITETKYSDGLIYFAIASISLIFMFGIIVGEWITNE